MPMSGWHFLAAQPVYRQVEINGVIAKLPCKKYRTMPGAVNPRNDGLMLQEHDDPKRKQNFL